MSRDRRAFKGVEQHMTNNGDGKVYGTHEGQCIDANQPRTAVLEKVSLYTS